MKTDNKQINTYYIVFKGNIGASQLAIEPRYKLKTKHISIKYNYCRYHIKTNTMNIKHISTHL